MNSRVHTLSIQTILLDAHLTPSMLLDRMNSVACGQLAASIKERNFNSRAKKEYVDKHLREYQMSRATLYNILKTKKASSRKAILIKQTLETIIKEQKLYEGMIVEIDIQEYER